MVEESENNYAQEESRKRPLEDQGNERTTKRYNAGGNQPLLKLLVPNYAAGALIGKGGAVMTEMKNKFGGNIRLSANRETYPGTNERVVVLTGEVSQIIDLNNHIMEKVQAGQSKQPEMRPTEEGRSEKVKIVLTNAAAGMLIGRGGLTIKAIQEESKAKISICSLEVASVPGERVLTMSGSMDQRIEACRQVIEKISGDASNMANTKVKYMDGGTGMGAGQESGMGSSFNNRQLGSMGSSFNNRQDNMVSSFNNRQPDSMGSLFNSRQQDSMGSLFNSRQQDSMVSSFNSRQQDSMGSSFNNSQQDSNNLFSVLSGNAMAPIQGANIMGLSNQSGKSKLKTKVEIQMEVPDILVGAILGKQGQIIREFVQRSGAKFKFSEKNEFAAGTTDRILTITGDMNQTQTAYSLINERVEQAGNQLNNR